MRSSDDSAGRVETPIPPALDRLVLSCLAQDPAERPQAAVALDASLAACETLPAWTAERAGRWWADHLPEAVS
jgi:eukaryotic-like serine/threonine-protein kinase